MGYSVDDLPYHTQGYRLKLQATEQDLENSPIIRIVGHDPLNVRCPKCQTKYDVLSGSGAVLSGSGRSPLRKYKAFYHEVERKLTIGN